MTSPIVPNEGVLLGRARVPGFEHPRIVTVRGDDVVDWTPAWTWGAALPLSAAALIAQFVKLAFILAAARRVDHLPHVASCGAHRRLAQQLARTAIKATVVVSPLSVAAPVKAAAAVEAENPQ